MAAHLSESRNERGRQVSSSQIIKFDEPIKKEEKPIIKQEIKLEEPKKLIEIKNGCLKIEYDFDLIAEFNNLDLSHLLETKVDANKIDKIELCSIINEKSMFLMKSFISHYKLDGELFEGVTYSGFEFGSKCYCKLILLVSENKQKLIYSQRRV